MLQGDGVKEELSLYWPAIPLCGDLVQSAGAVCCSVSVLVCQVSLTCSASQHAAILNPRHRTM